MAVLLPRRPKTQRRRFLDSIYCNFIPSHEQELRLFVHRARARKCLWTKEKKAKQKAKSVIVEFFMTRLDRSQLRNRARPEPNKKNLETRNAQTFCCTCLLQSSTRRSQNQHIQICHKRSGFIC